MLTEVTNLLTASLHPTNQKSPQNLLNQIESFLLQTWHEEKMKEKENFAKLQQFLLNNLDKLQGHRVAEATKAMEAIISIQVEDPERRELVEILSNANKGNFQSEQSTAQKEPNNEFLRERRKKAR
jgi:secreted Zn-dependent insulinase-like peptidase